MTDLAVIQATFCDFRIVKGRKQAQLVFELPLEMAQDAITKLGMPQPSDPAWCAIALLNREAAAPPSPDKSAAARERGKEQYRQKDAMEQAAVRAVLLCKDKTFQQWMAELRDASWHATKGEEYCSAQMRNYLEIASRRDIGSNDRAYQAFLALETQFKMDAGQMAERR